MSRLADLYDAFSVSLSPAERFRQTVGEPDPWQEELFATDPVNSEDDRFVMVLSGRQQGKSTSCGCIAYDDFTMGKTVILAAPSLRQSTELFRRILDFKYSDPFPPKIVRQTLTELEAHPSHGGRILVVPASDQARGMTADTVLADEAAFVDSDALTALFPMRKEHGRIILLSTPAGRQGYFSETWSAAKVRRIHVRSTDVPRLSKKVEFDRKTMSDLRFRQEHLTEFLGGGVALIPYSVLESANSKEKALCL